MDETARTGFPEVKLGISPGSGGISRLPRLVGPAKAYELLYTGELIDAHEAHRIGLVNRLAPACQALSAAVGLAESLANAPPLALGFIPPGLPVSRTQTTNEPVNGHLAAVNRASPDPASA